jgi:Cu-processing system permease protein
MNASSSVGAVASGPRPRRASEGVPVPARWRAGQVVGLVLVALLAAYFHFKGWRSPEGPRPTDTRTLADYVGFGLLGALVWLTTPIAGVIAATTFHEALRRRWMLVLLAFSALLLGVSPAFTGLQPGEEERFLQDFGIGFIITMTLLMAIFLGVALVPPDVERRTIFTILSKPVNRSEFILGKFLGLAGTLLLALVVLGVVFLGAYALFVIGREGSARAWQVDPTTSHVGLGFSLSNLLNALILHYGQLMVMSALALLLSLMVSNITAIVFCFLAYFGGQMSSYWQNLGSSTRQLNEAAPAISRGMQGVVNVVYYALPRLDRFDVRDKLVQDAPIAFNTVWKAWDSGIIYSAILLVVASLIFSDREF